MTMGSPPKITVNPHQVTLVDQKVEIIVSNLSPEQNVTLRARTVGDDNIVFESSARYKANQDGEVLVATQPSLSGSYTGVEPMGLFWSMKPITAEPDRHNLLKKRDTTTPLNVTIDVCVKGIGEDEVNQEQHIEASTTLARWFMAPGVTRCFVEGNGFYGTLFLPPGGGPFPGVIDLWGRPGGIREDRAALLASNGFASLALAYWGFRDLPEKFGTLDISYFETAVDWLTAHPKVMSNGVGLVGLSMGGVLALGIASQIPHKIKAVVSISGHNVLIGGSLKCRDLTIQGYPVDQIAGDYVSYSHFLSIFQSKEACKPGSSSFIPVEHIMCPVFLVYGLADELNTEIEWMCDDVFQRMEKRGKGSLCRKLGLPGSGHFITPCYLPPCTRHYVKTYDDIWFLGGEHNSQGKASEIYWRESLTFLRNSIVGQSP